MEVVPLINDHCGFQLLVERSRELFLVPWRLYHHVHENYDPFTGESWNKANSDPFYNWGALLAYIGIQDAEVVASDMDADAIEVQ